MKNQDHLHKIIYPPQTSAREVPATRRHACSIKIIYVMGIVAALISAQKFQYLPELQLIVIATVALVFFNRPYYFLATAVIVLSTHFYAVPDIVYRFNSSDYPSIYTKNIGNIKVLDILIVILFVYGLAKSIRTIPMPLIAPTMSFGFLGFFSMILLPSEQVEYRMALFQIRNLLLVIGVYLISVKVGKERLLRLCFLALFCWISTMIFAIIFPAENPLYRDFFGYNWNIYFAGDEYLSFGIYAASASVLARDLLLKGVNVRMLLLAAVALVLALFSQRIGSLQYFFVVFLVLSLSSAKRWGQRIAKLVIVLPSFGIILLYPFVDLFSNVSATFDAYGQLLVSGAQSWVHLLKEAPGFAVFGLGFAGKYEIIGLSDYLDNPFAFGSEVGEQYRYAVWGLPFGRILFGAGLLGYLFVLIFIVYYLVSNTPPDRYYLLMVGLSLIVLAGLTPVSAVPLGLALGVLALTKSPLPHSPEPVGHAFDHPNRS